MLKQIFIKALFILTILVLSISYVEADERDDEIVFLKSQIKELQKRVEKLEAVQTIAKPGQAVEITAQTREEIREAVKEEVADVKSDLVPKWWQNIKLKGDFRLRYEWDKDKGQNDNNRARIRARLGLEAKVNEQMKAGVSISTGKTSDPRSTNITLGSSSSSNTPGSTKDIVLYYAYGEYRPFNWAVLTAGKFKNPLWLVTDMLWDPDLNPEGVVAQFISNINPEVRIFINNLFFVLRNDDRNTTQPYMYAIQPGLNWEITDGLNVKTAVTYYGFTSIKGKARFSTYSGTNTLVNNNYRYGYDVINPTLEISIKEPFDGLVPHLSFFGDFVNNFDSSRGENGFDAGFKFGHESIDEKGKWQAKIAYVMLERDAWLDIFPESSRYSGKTNIRGVDGVLEYGIARNSSLVAHYYYVKSLSEPENPEHVLQIDWNLRF